MRLGAGRSIGLSLALLASGLISEPMAHGIYNGTSALGSRYVVKLVSAGATCSGALISSRIVATAAHCVIRAGKAVGAEPQAPRRLTLRPRPAHPPEEPAQPGESAAQPFAGKGFARPAGLPNVCFGHIFSVASTVLPHAAAFPAGGPWFEGVPA